jgi:ribonuclease HII
MVMPYYQLGLEARMDVNLSPSVIAGVDEVGRGALFGPVVAAAVILTKEGALTLCKSGVTDSKQLSERQREHLAVQILATALDCQIGWASAREIDRLNILQASLLAMKRAITRLHPRPQLCLIDGNQRIPTLDIPQQTLIKGDQRSIEIAAASIIAKVWRDRLIQRLSKRYPGYDLLTNKGYGTKAHRVAIQRIGVSRQHRNSFAPCRLSQISELNQATYADGVCGDNLPDLMVGS